MLHTVAFAASLTSLGLMAAIHYCHVHAAPKSWARSELLAMVLLALLCGAFPLALFASGWALWNALGGGFTLATLAAAGTDLVSFAAVIGTAVIFRRSVIAVAENEAAKTSATITPLTPRPTAPGGPANTTRRPRKAA